MSDKTMGEKAREAYHTACNVDLSELNEWWECVKDGDAHAWQAAAEAAIRAARTTCPLVQHSMEHDKRVDALEIALKLHKDLLAVEQEDSRNYRELNNKAWFRVEELERELAQLRHDLRNEQAASRMAHEVVEKNKELEAENAQLRHALANAQVAAGFAREKAERVKELQEDKERLIRAVTAIDNIFDTTFPNAIHMTVSDARSMLAEIKRLLADKP